MYPRDHATTPPLQSTAQHTTPPHPTPHHPTPYHTTPQLDKFHARKDKISEMATLMTAQKWTVDDARQNDIVMIDTNLTMV